MRNLTEALYAKAAGSAFMISIGNRFFDTEAPPGAEFPYCVYLIVSDVKDWQFVERFEDVLIQFSIFSKASSSGEVKDIYTLLLALYDEQYLTVGGMTQFLWLWRNNLTTMRDEVTTPAGTVGVWHYAIDFDCYYEV